MDYCYKLKMISSYSFKKMLKVPTQKNPSQGTVQKSRYLLPIVFLGEKAQHAKSHTQT